MLSIRNILILGNLVLLLAYFNYSIGQKEAILKEGQLVLLKLAPVDPRSLMQGDYMRLRYDIESSFRSNYDFDSIPQTGYCVVSFDGDHIAHLVRFQEGTSPKKDSETLIEFNKDQWDIDLGAGSFFFQEGMSEAYEAAEYGGLRVSEHGNTVLVGLYNEDLELIE